MNNEVETSSPIILDSLSDFISYLLWGSGLLGPARMRITKDGHSPWVRPQSQLSGAGNSGECDINPAIVSWLLDRAALVSAYRSGNSDACTSDEVFLSSYLKRFSFDLVHKNDWVTEEEAGRLTAHRENSRSVLTKTSRKRLPNQQQSATRFNVENG